VVDARIVSEGEEVFCGLQYERTRRNMRIVAIDPSYEKEGLGYAIFEDEKLTSWGTIDSGVEKDASFEVKVSATIDALNARISDWCTPMRLVIEMPEVWGGFKAAMSSKTGVLHKLFFFVGALWYWAWRSDNIVPVLIPVRKWKGQLPKEVMRGRIERSLNIKTNSTHEADAIGLGLYYMKNQKAE